jgi:hypothetical protein
MYKSMKNTGSIPVILLLCILIISLLPACQSSTQTQTPPAVTPPTLPANPPEAQPPAPVVTTGTAIKWVADGVISADEYQNNRVYGDYTISWSNDAEYVYIGMQAKTAGWVAVGFGAETFMKNADIIEGSMKDGNLTIADMFSTGEFGPHPPDTQLGGTDDILASAGKFDNGYTVIEFKRKLDTGDKFDKPLSKGINKIIWAYANEPLLTLKHSSRGSGEIELR